MMHRLSVIAALALAGAAFGQSVRTGLPFLKMGAGAASVAMADAATAHATGATALFYDPAGLADAAGATLLVMHNESIQDVRLDVLGASLPLGSWTLGLGVQANTVADVPIRDAATIDPLGTFTAIEGAVSFGAATHVTPDLAVGGAIKALVQKIYTNEAGGGAIDLGARYHRAASPLALAVSVQNLGTMGVLENESTRLPVILRAAASWEDLMDAAGEFRYTAVAGVDRTIGDDLMHVRLGGEAGYANTVFVRGGLHTGYEASLFTAGAGFRYRTLHVGYALAPYGQGYGLGHTFSIDLDL